MDFLSGTLPEALARCRLAALALLLLPAVAGADLFSPGELARPHASLEGLKNCTQCHQQGQQLGQERCLACHTELQDPVRDGKGFHGRIPPAQRECQACHHEHQGRDFPLIAWSPSKKGFPHEKTGFALRGKHGTVECAKCHQRRLVEAAPVRAVLEKQPRRETFLGLPTRCGACHFDEHRGQLEGRCESCHTEQGWRPASGFDHGRTSYALEGKHRSVACGKCHAAQEDTRTPKDAFPAPVSASFLSFGRVPHASCLDCHQDPHGGRLGEGCSGCHTPAGWQGVKGAGADRAFHDRTRFPLKGLHAGVQCQGCHGAAPGRRSRFKGLPFGACTDCHADAHIGQLTASGGGRKGAERPCDECHTLNGFTTPSFGPEEHAKTRYPLEGAHRVVACALCHPQQPALERRIPAAVLRELKRQRRPERFSFALFDLPAGGERGERCEACHDDPHAGQLAGRAAAQGCSSCHQLTSFADLRLDHGRDSRFPLTGKHAQAPCAGCHRPEKIQKATVVRYRPLPTGCADCHADAHAGQFSAEGSAAGCDRCHTTEGFQARLFAHAPPFTSFALEGKHAAAPCASCHPAVPVSKGLTIRRYRPLPTTCEGCHEDFHQGAFRGFVP